MSANCFNLKRGCTDEGASDAPHSSAKKIGVCCAICSEIIAPEDIASLHCGHLFHFICIMYFFLYGWSSCPECNQPSHMGDIMSHRRFNSTEENRSDAPRDLDSYRSALRQLHKSYMTNMEMEKRELYSTIEMLKLKAENYELKKKYLELAQENRALKRMLMMQP